MAVGGLGNCSWKLGVYGWGLCFRMGVTSGEGLLKALEGFSPELPPELSSS